MKKTALYCLFLSSVAFIPVRSIVTPIPIHPEFTLSQNQFAFHLLKAVLQQDTSKSNKLISPLGVYLTLAMLYNGAGHATRDSISEVLQASDMELSSLNGLCKELLQRLPLEDDRVHLTMANSIWYNRKKLHVQPSFESVVENFYYAPVQSLNFNGPAAALQINRWIDQNTFHRIPGIIGRTSPEDLLYLVNAMYFKSDWSVPFRMEDTYKDSFYTGGTAMPIVSYMKKEFVARVFSDTSFSMIELPCGNGKNFAVYMILPEDEQRSIREFTAALSPGSLNNALSKMTDQATVLSLPRWEYDYSIDDLRPALYRLGMGNAFNLYEDADLSNLCTTDTRKAYLSRVLHKTAIRVNENGMEAAAALPGATISDEIARRPHRPRIIRADHPFLYFLLEKQRNIILFTGVVNDPSPLRMEEGPKKPMARVRRKHSLF